MELDEQEYEENNLTDNYELTTATVTIVNGDQSPLQQQMQMQVQMQPIQPQPNQVMSSMEYDDIKPKILNPEASNTRVSGVKGKRKLLAQHYNYVTLQQLFKSNNHQNTFQSSLSTKQVISQPQKISSSTKFCKRTNARSLGRRSTICDR
jgi:hypothetical protein